MTSIPSTPPRRGWSLGLAALSILCGAVKSQDFALRVADPNPLGIGRFVPTSADLLSESAVGGVEAGLKGAFAFNAALDTQYDSNFFLTENNSEDEVSVNFIPSVSYTSDPEGGALYTFRANYKPAFRAYLNNSDLNDIDQSGNMLFAMRGSRTEVSLFANYAQITGTDRLTGSFNTGWTFSTGVRANREIASRTSMNGGLSYSMSDYSSGNLEGSTFYSGYFGGLWQATGRTSLGGTLRYTQSESDNSGTRDAWALLAEARYRAGERIWLSASIGPEFANDSDSGDNTVNLSADFQCRYVINERWSWLNSLGTATVPSPSTTGYVVNNYGFITQLEHQLLRATLNGGIQINYSEYQESGNAAVTRDNEENYSIFLTYNRGFFNDRLSFNSAVRYSLNNGEEAWRQWLVSMGLSMPF